MKTKQVQSSAIESEDDTATSEQLLGQEVFSRTGKKVGQVQDLVVDFNTQKIDGLLVTNVNPDLFTQDSVPNKFVIPYSWVQDADSIVITVPISAERVNFK